MRKWAISGLILAAAAGCELSNRPLNDVRRPLESRVRNQSRSTMSAQFGLLQPPSGLMREGGGTPPVATSRPTPTGRPADYDDTFVGIAISGGGSRSANFSAACLFELQKVGLLPHVDYISTVSGGSLTGAYYCSHSDDDWNPASVQGKFSFPFASDALGQSSFAFWNAFGLLFTSLNRSDILAESFDNILFRDERRRRSLTFNDLRDDRPRLLINATDLQSGRRFVFSNESFDELNSDLSQYPLAYAVTASSAVPVVLHPVTLRDHSTIFRQYRHLVDGGVADNLGVQTLAELYDTHNQDADLKQTRPPYPRGAVLIVIDSTTSFDRTLSERREIGMFEGLQLSANLTATNLLNRASSATMAEMIVKYSPPDVPAETLRSQIRQLQEQNYLDFTGQSGRPVRIIRLSLDHLGNLKELPFKGFAQTVNSIDTFFNIDPTAAYHLYQAAGLLVGDHYAARLRPILTDLQRAASAAPATRPPTQP
jgi:predicted acylesterase/phospholipase RssA